MTCLVIPSVFNSLVQRLLLVMWEDHNSCLQDLKWQWGPRTAHLESRPHIFGRTISRSVWSHSLWLPFSAPLGRSQALFWWSILNTLVNKEPWGRKCCLGNLSSAVQRLSFSHERGSRMALSAHYKRGRMIAGLTWKCLNLFRMLQQNIIMWVVYK